MTEEDSVESGLYNVGALRWDPAVSSRGQRGRDEEETLKEGLCLHYRSAQLVLRN